MSHRLLSLVVEGSEAYAKTLSNNFKIPLDKLSHNPALSLAQDLVHREGALFIRASRVEDGLTWKEVARRYIRRYALVAAPTQLLGMALCEWAAFFFNEHYLEEPWI